MRIGFMFWMGWMAGLTGSAAWAACSVNSGNGDALALLLEQQESCPRDAFELRAALLRDGLTLRTTLVGNRGFHNPGQGSFSLFEMGVGHSESTGLTLAPGDFFFGHFTAPKGTNEVAPDQAPASGALMVELIAWDGPKGMYNFYELIGDGTQGRWFYRGDSADIALDVRFLHRQPGPAHPQFGNTLRCAGCHTAGGPIMKELASPHNDWWVPDHVLPFGDRHPDPALTGMLQTLVSADELSEAVKTGIFKLQGSQAYRTFQGSQSFQELLRPLFCAVELNLESDPASAEDHSATIEIPSGFFVNPLLAFESVKASTEAYAHALGSLGSHFPETDDPDADHAWLTPVKAYSDLAAIRALVEAGIVDESFVSAVLAVDMMNPVFSPARCALLRAVPEHPSANWLADFVGNLKEATQSSDAGTTGAAAELVANLSDPSRGPEFQQSRADAFLRNCQEKLAASDLRPYVALLAERRQEARVNEISKNPLGQILEPGFRVIFPEIDSTPEPESLALGEDCEVKELNGQ